MKIESWSCKTNGQNDYSCDIRRKRKKKKVGHPIAQPQNQVSLYTILLDVIVF